MLDVSCRYKVVQNMLTPELLNYDSLIMFGHKKSLFVRLESVFGSYWVPEHPRPIKTNRVRIQNPDPTITNGLRNISKG